MKKVILCLLFFAFALVQLSLSQNKKDLFLLGPKYGISAYYNYNFQSVNMRQFLSVPDSVPLQAAGNMPGYSFGAFYEYRFTGRTSLMMRAMYSYHKAEISGDTPETLYLNGSDTLGLSNHIITANLSNIRLEPLLRYRLFEKLSLFGGINAGIRFNNSMEHTEQVKEPEGALYSGGENLREIDEMSKDDIGLLAAFVFGFSYDIPINYNGTYIFTPEVLVESGFSDITSNIMWDINSVRMGFSFKYSENPTVIPEIENKYEYRELINTINVAHADIEKEFITSGKTYITIDSVLKKSNLIITETLNRTDTLFYPQKAKIEETTITENIEKEAIDKNCLQIYSMGSDGTDEQAKSSLKVEEFLSTSIQPLLNYIFFEHNSAIIPSRYEMFRNDETDYFQIEELRNLSTLPTYYQILNIIAKRMVDNPKSEITLTGCNSGINQEKENIGLSRARAEAVKDYFVKVWSIKPGRIKVNAVNLPEKSSNTNDPDGIEENRRVEITSKDLSVIAPVIINDTLREVSPPQIRFYNNANTCFKIGSWNLEVFQSGKALIGFRGKSNMPERIIWRLREAKQTIPCTSEPVTYQLEIVDFNGHNFKSNIDSIPVNQITIKKKDLNKEGDKKVDKYSLILFDFDKSDLNKSNKRILNFINGKIKRNSKVLIQGYSDRMGDDEHNLTLSNRRASNVASKVLNSNDINSEGIGEMDLIYNNELPEGRFYCRTVKITVETPIKK
ncbi:OmpA family protein [Bacteroidota bacterium]